MNLFLEWMTEEQDKGGKYTGPSSFSRGTKGLKNPRRDILQNASWRAGMIFFYSSMYINLIRVRGMSLSQIREYASGYIIILRQKVRYILKENRRYLFILFHKHIEP